jgi:hypothetical protein
LIQRLEPCAGLGEGLANGAPVKSAATRFAVTASTACAPGGSFTIGVLRGITVQCSIGALIRDDSEDLERFADAKYGAYRETTRSHHSAP